MLWFQVSPGWFLLALSLLDHFLFLDILRLCFLFCQFDYSIFSLVASVQCQL